MINSGGYDLERGSPRVSANVTFAKHRVLSREPRKVPILLAIFVVAEATKSSRVIAATVAR